MRQKKQETPKARREGGKVRKTTCHNSMQSTTVPRRTISPDKWQKRPWHTRTSLKGTKKRRRPYTCLHRHLCLREASQTAWGPSLPTLFFTPSFSQKNSTKTTTRGSRKVLFFSSSSWFYWWHLSPLFKPPAHFFFPHSVVSLKKKNKRKKALHTVSLHLQHFHKKQRYR